MEQLSSKYGKNMKQIEHLSSLAPQSPSNITGPHVLSVGRG